MEFDVLDRKTHVLKTHFLEASAGTGKTFAIEHITVRLLLQEEKLLSLSDILLVTFTRAATRELKSRIRAAIKNALFHLEQGSSPWDYLQEILETASSQEKAILKLKEALLSFDHAQVFTIHGFCHQLLKAFAFQAGIPLEVEDPDVPKHIEIARSSVKEFLKFKLDTKEYSTDQISKAIRKYRYEIGKLEEKMGTLVLQDHEIKASPSFAESYALFYSHLQALPSVDAETFLQDFAILTASYKQMATEEIQAQGLLFAKKLSTKEWSLQDFERLLKSSCFFLEKLDSSNQKAKVREIPLKMPELFASMKRELLPIYQAAKDPTEIILRLSRDAKRLYQEKMEAQEHFSPDHLLLQMKQALRNPTFLSYAQNRYKAAIIDEFQDTDPVQWEIFKTLFLGRAEAFYLVGDPKQAIYAFRSADIYTYLSALEALGEEHRQSLNTNFRSVPPLILALNALFSQSSIPIPKRDAHLPIHPVQAGRKEGAGGIHFFVRSEDPSPRTKRWPSEEIEENYFFPFMASELIRLKKPWGSSAILVRDKFQADRIASFLKKAGIPVTLKRKGSLVDAFAFEVLRELLEATIFTSDLSKLKKALSSPCIDWKAGELKATLLSSSLRAAKMKFSFLKTVFDTQGFARFFDAFLKTEWGKGKTTEENLKAYDPSFTLELQQLVEILIKEEIAHATKGVPLLFFLKKAKNHEEIWNLEERQGGEAVQILTIHMSKGLEFDTVFAYGLISRGATPEEITAEGATRAFDAQDPLCQEALGEVDAEKLRQLYVALTRAKTHLYIPLLLSSSLPSHNGSPLELFFKAQPSEVYAHLENLAQEHAVTITRLTEPFSVSPVAPELPQEKIEKQVPHLFSQEQGIFSFTTLAHPLVEVIIPKKVVENGITLNTLPLGKETGILLHHILEKIFQKKAHQDPQKMLPIIAEAVANTPCAPWKEILTLEIPTLFDLPFETLDGPIVLSHLQEDHFFEEMEFAYQIPQGMMKGVIDLAFSFRGKYYLLDWKTNYLEDYTENSMQHAILEHDYKTQASLYSQALRRYVKLFDNAPFGGAFYVFIRGKRHVFLSP